MKEIYSPDVIKNPDKPCVVHLIGKDGGEKYVDCINLTDAKIFIGGDVNEERVASVEVVLK